MIPPNCENGPNGGRSVTFEVESIPGCDCGMWTPNIGLQATSPSVWDRKWNTTREWGSTWCLDYQQAVLISRCWLWFDDDVTYFNTSTFSCTTTSLLSTAKSPTMTHIHDILPLMKNRIRVVKSQPNFINLEGTHFFLCASSIEFPSTWKKWDITRLWAPVWVYVSPIDDTSCWIIAQNDSRLTSVAYSHTRNTWRILITYCEEMGLGSLDLYRYVLSLVWYRSAMVVLWDLLASCLEYRKVSAKLWWRTLYLWVLAMTWLWVSRVFDEAGYR